LRPISKLSRFLPVRINALVTLGWARSEASLLTTYGYAESLRSRLPVDEDGNSIPWMPYCVVALLKQRLRSDLKVLEFGAGFSTLFFMERVASVTSIEHDAEWLRRLEKRVSSNVTLLATASSQEKDYCMRAGDSTNRYDVILIDGIHRVCCFRVALEVVSENGVIILDDSERPEYVEVFELASEAGFRMLPLEGHKAGSAGLHRAVFFYRERNCLGI